jgi:hypothetical protein
MERQEDYHRKYVRSGAVARFGDRVSTWHQPDTVGRILAFDVTRFTALVGWPNGRRWHSIGALDPVTVVKRRYAVPKAVDRRARQLMEAAETVGVLSTATIVAPHNEGQAA